MSAVTFEALDIPIGDVIVADRLREPSSEAIERIASSMKEVGQIAPIEVMRGEDNRFHLVSGAHRIEALKSIGKKTVRAIVYVGDQIDMKLREIDENLHRAELSPYDEATFLAARFNIWKALRDAPLRGGDRRSIRWRDQVCQVAKVEKNELNQEFFAETSAAIGVSSSTIYRAIKRRNNLATHWDQIKATEAFDNGSLLDKLAKLNRFDLDDVMALVATGLPIAEAIRNGKAPRKVASSDPENPNQLLKKINNLWAVLPDKQRQKFLIKHGLVVAGQSSGKTNEH